MEARQLVQEMYTIEDILALPEGERAELLDGNIYNMASPSEIHQRVLMELCLMIGSHIKNKGGSCRVYPAPFAVFLNNDRDYLEPDIVVVCDPDQLKKGDGCHGAPDLVMEIVSPNSASHDYLRKTAAYSDAGVKEYWIVDPDNEIINVYNFGNEIYHPAQYDFTEQVKVGIFEDLVIDFSQINL
jgi:Uma2 family endonuclease